ncbi:MAG: hypothetical protein ACI8TQ_003263 [Planctomycetota bacterium]|jgi:hypothetical protein
MFMAIANSCGPELGERDALERAHSILRSGTADDAVEILEEEFRRIDANDEQFVAIATELCQLRLIMGLRVWGIVSLLCEASVGEQAPVKAIDLRLIHRFLSQDGRHDRALQLCTFINSAQPGGELWDSWNCATTEQYVHRLNQQDWDSGYYHTDYLLDDAWRDLLKQLERGEELVPFEISSFTISCDEIGQLGQVDDPLRFFHESGATMAKGIVSNGARQGTWTIYRPDGTLKEQLDFVDDVRHGTRTQFTTSGQVWRRTIYSHSLLHGKLESYSDGVLESEHEFRYGWPKDEDPFDRGVSMHDTRQLNSTSDD